MQDWNGLTILVFFCNCQNQAVVCLSVNLSVYLSVYPSISLPVNLPVCLLVCLPDHLSGHPVCPSVCPSISPCLHAHLSICLSIQGRHGFDSHLGVPLVCFAAVTWLIQVLRLHRCMFRLTYNIVVLRYVSVIEVVDVCPSCLLPAVFSWPP